MSDKFANRIGNLATLGTVVAGFVISYFGNPAANHLPLAVLCVIFALFCIFGFDWIQKSRIGNAAPIIYLVIAIALALALLSINLNMSIVIFPLVSQAISAKNWRWSLVTSLILIIGFAIIAWQHRLLPSSIATYVASLTSGIIFVVAFTEMTKRAHEDRAEMERLAFELRQANLKLGEYATQVEELATTRERNRLAREIHDSLGHYLTVVNVQLEAAQTLLTNNPSRASAALAKAQNLTKEGLNEVRRSVAALRTSPTENKSLRDAITQLIEENAASGIRTTFEVNGNERKLQPAVELTLYRTVQEGLTNIRKHSHATDVKVSLNFANTQTNINILDNGTTPPSDKNIEGFGLLGLRERVQLLGGTCETHQSDAGFELAVSVPMQEAA